MPGEFGMMGMHAHGCMEEGADDCKNINHILLKIPWRRIEDWCTLVLSSIMEAGDEPPGLMIAKLIQQENRHGQTAVVYLLLFLFKLLEAER
jgi:hypothetical protein